MKHFSELGLSEPISSALTELKFEVPTEIQAKAIPVALEGKDIMASAQTGSGKTGAFALPVIEKLLASQYSKKPRALVLVPTRELALQVQDQINQFAKHTRLRTVTIYGGTGYEKQVRLLRRGVDVIVATPGRLMDHMEQRIADLSGIEILVLDEADRLMDMGFMPQVKKIVARVQKERQTLMFSATIDKRIEQIAREFQKNPVTLHANSHRIEPKEIEQKLFYVHEFDKDDLLIKLIRESNMESVLVFTRTRRKAAWVRSRLVESHVLAEEIHSDISQSKREKTLANYRKGNFNVLVATDVAARGLDIPTISHVVNYDLPDCPKDYVHRIGRTGRAGRSGIALSFVSDEQRSLVRDIERVTGRQLDPNAPKHKPAAGGGGRRPAGKAGSRSFRPRSGSGGRSGGGSGRRRAV